MTFDPASRVSVGDAALGVGGATFVELKNAKTRTTYVAKYTAAGTLDTGWGTRGVTQLNGDVSHLAYDGKTGYLYVGGVSSRRDTVFVQRLGRDGQVQTFFGTHGVLTYGQDYDAATQSSTIALQGMVARPSGRVLLAVRREVVDRPAEDAPFYDNGTSTTDVALVQLQVTGRDSNYAKRGILSLLGGQTANYVYDGEKDSNGSFVSATDLRPRDDGGVNVVLTRQKGTAQTYTVNPNSPTTYYGELTVKSRVVSAAGGVDAGRANSWRITPADTTGGLQPLLAVGRGDGGVDLIGDAIVNYETPGLARDALVPGVTPRGTPFAVDGLAVTALTRDASGYTYAQVGPSTVAKLNSRFQPLRSFGRRGFAQVGDTVTRFVPADTGRVLALDDDAFSRLV